MNDFNINDLKDKYEEIQEAEAKTLDSKHIKKKFADFQADFDKFYNEANKGKNGFNMMDVRAIKIEIEKLKTKMDKIK